MYIGVDTGGTFTDFVVWTGNKTHSFKILSTPDDPSQAILEGLAKIPGYRSASIIHGSTVATNALVERKGARVAFITTAGFEDILSIGRQNRAELYNLKPKSAGPIVPRNLCFGIKERIGSAGNIIIPLDENDLERLIKTIKAKKVEAVSICLLHSYRNPSHEKKIEKKLKSQGLKVSASYKILSEYREYERSSTTVVNAYVAPIMDRYLSKLRKRIPRNRLRVMQSNGGSISAKAASTFSVHTILSGPAGGVVGATAIGQAAGYKNIITFDMGGTSTDVCLVPGEVKRTSETTIEGMPLRVPIIDIHTIGAGGGSIASIDPGGALRVGPQSAGADPGPVCYGKGKEVTVTDADLILGRLCPEHFLGGTMLLKQQAAKAAIKKLAKKVGYREAELAQGIVKVVNTNMERALRVISIERGYDPREFALVSFGGAGGMHCCELARSLSIKTIIVPNDAGVLSAHGMLLADIIKDYSQSLLKPAKEVDMKNLNNSYLPMIKRGTEELQKEGMKRAGIKLFKFIDLRYKGQSYEITIPLTLDFERKFHAEHNKTYGYATKDKPVEIVNIRLKAVGLPDKPRLKTYGKRRSGEKVRPVKHEQVTYDSKKLKIPYFLRKTLSPGYRSAGPVVILDYGASTFIPPDFSFSVDKFLNLIIKDRR